MTQDDAGIRAALAALKPEIRQMLAEDLPVDRQRSEEAYAAGRWGQLREQVHRVKGSASFCHLDALRDACVSVEEQASTGTPPAAEAMALFSTEVARILALLGP